MHRRPIRQTKNEAIACHKSHARVCRARDDVRRFCRNKKSGTEAKEEKEEVSSGIGPSFPSLPSVPFQAAIDPPRQ
jgi:hypothetical protein